MITIPEQFKKTFLPDQKKLFYKLLIGGSVLGILTAALGRLAFHQKTLEEIEFGQMVLWHFIATVVISVLSAYMH